MFYEGINTKVIRRSIAFAIAVVVTSRSSSFEYTISVHAVHTGVERNVYNIVVSIEMPPNFHQSISNVPLIDVCAVFKTSHQQLRSYGDWTQA